MRDFTYPATILTAKTLFKALGIKFQTSGTEHIPRTGGAILAANHIGYVDFIFDGLAAQPSKRLVRFMAKKDAFDHKISGPLMRSYHHISVDRANGEQSYRDAVDLARSGEIVGIFPEATISRSFEIKELKTGAVRMAAEAGVPLIPMVTWGTQLLKTKDHEADLTGRGKTIGLHVGAPLSVTGEDPVAETQRLREAMIDAAGPCHRAVPAASRRASGGRRPVTAAPRPRSRRPSASTKRSTPREPPSERRRRTDPRPGVRTVSRRRGCRRPGVDPQTDQQQGDGRGAIEPPVVSRSGHREHRERQVGEGSQRHGLSDAATAPSATTAAHPRGSTASPRTGRDATGGPHVEAESWDRSTKPLVDESGGAT